MADRSYQRRKERSRARQASQSASGRDIGPLPPIVNPARRGEGAYSFRRFCETYLADRFSLAWSPDHLVAIERIEAAVLRGGLFALAMPRGSGKTTLVEAAVLWCLVYGHRPFSVLIGADEAHASAMLENVKLELETNELLAADFPELCVPIRRLEGIANRAKGQTYQGQRTYIAWHRAEIVLPTIPGSASSGCRVRARGITGRIRGMMVKRKGRPSLRPSLAVIDDPQTEESANSPFQVARRLSVLTGAILGLAGPGQTIAGVMPCTVIAPGDMADQIIDAAKHPQWHGLRTKLVYTWSDEKPWRQYAQLRADAQRAGQEPVEATEFYRANREKMDAGARVAWPERHAPDELSALQHAWNLRLDVGEASFASEYQNEPLVPDESSVKLTAEGVARQLSNVPRGAVPKTAEHLTAFIDVHSEILYWIACAWAADFSGWVLDYGTHPKQPARYFAQRNPPRTLAAAHPGTAEDAWLLAGLTEATGAILGRVFQREDGASLRVAKLLIDAHWGQKTELVKAFCRRHVQSWTIVCASIGQYVGASSKPYHEYRPEPGAMAGHRWRVPPPRAGDRYVLIDVNWWKTCAAGRLMMAPGTPGSWLLFGRDAEAHRLFADHCTAETPVETTAKGRTVLEWKQKPGQDNHWWDAIVGAAVGASMLGIAFPGAEPAGRRKRVKLSEIQRQRAAQ